MSVKCGQFIFTQLIGLTFKQKTNSLVYMLAVKKTKPTNILLHTSYVYMHVLT